MSDFDIVQDLAKQALSTSTEQGGVDKSLWDRAQRLVRNVEHICRLPELAGSGLQTDHFCLITATYFYDSGMAWYFQTKHRGAQTGAFNKNGLDLLSFSVEVVEEKLSDILNIERIEKVNRIITERNSHFTKMTEAKILSDARNLDDMGMVGIFNELKSYACNGKSVSDVLKTWQRKMDYRYWQARLKESFRFDSVREIAEERLSVVESFMNQLKIENTAKDLERLCLNSAFA